MANKGRLMSVKEVADYLGISRLTLYRLISAGELSGFKIGGVWRFKEENIEDYLARTRTPDKGTRYRGRLFDTTLLVRYYQDPKKYQITKKGIHQWLSLYEEYLTGLTEEEQRRQGFEPVKYQRICLEHGRTAAVVTPGYFDRLSEEEKEWWVKWEIHLS